MRITPTRIFQIQRISAIALLVFMTTHMVVVHYPPMHIDFSQIIVRMGEPIWKVIDILFLLSVLTHALAGMYMVLTDLQKIGPYRQALGWIAVVLFVVFFAYGTKTIIAFQPPV